LCLFAIVRSRGGHHIKVTADSPERIHSHDPDRAHSHGADRVLRIAMALAPPSAGPCRTGPVVLTAEPIAGHGAEVRGGNPARTIRMPPVPSTWIPRAETGISTGSSSGLETRHAAMPGNAAAEAASAAAWNVHFPFRYHDERRGRSGRTHADPPICMPLAAEC
jgi:hypothetical protein